MCQRSPNVFSKCCAAFGCCFFVKKAHPYECAFKLISKEFFVFFYYERNEVMNVLVNLFECLYFNISQCLSRSWFTHIYCIKRTFITGPIAFVSVLFGLKRNKHKNLKRHKDNQDSFCYFIFTASFISSITLSNHCRGFNEIAGK